MNSIAVEAKRRELRDRAQNVVDTKAATNAEKIASLDAISAELKRLDAETEYNTRAAAVGRYMPDEAAVKGKTSTSFAPLALGDAQSRALFKAATDGIAFKAATLTTTVDPATHSGQILPPVKAAREVTRILDLIPQQATNTAVQEFYVVSPTGTAGVTAEGAAKPEATIALTRQMVTAEKIAVWSSVSEEALTDFATFEQVLRTDLTASVIDRENQEILSGTGTAPSTFKGLLTATGTQTIGNTGTFAGATTLDVIGAAADLLRAGGRYVSPDAIVMNPNTWGAIRRAKATGSGDYLLGSPTEAANLSIWGIPVVVTSQCPAGKVVVANFQEAATAFVRASLSIRTNAQGSGFRSNLIEVIAEERIALAVTAPSAIAVVTIS